MQNQVGYKKANIVWFYLQKKKKKKKSTIGKFIELENSFEVTRSEEERAEWGLIA